jgi:hypothetical protein
MVDFHQGIGSLRQKSQSKIAIVSVGPCVSNVGGQRRSGAIFGSSLARDAVQGIYQGRAKLEQVRLLCRQEGTVVDSSRWFLAWRAAGSPIER